MPQCKCKTNDGSRCKRSSNPDSEYGFCTQHHSHDKMRCVSLARKSIGYFSPKTQPSYPRPSKNSKRKSPKRSPRRK